MPSRTIEDSIAIREWIAKALDAGQDSPRRVKEYIEQYSELDPPPSIATVGNIMKELGYYTALCQVGEERKEMRAKKLFGAAAKVLIAGIVLAFLALQTIKFFKYTFPPEQQYYAYLGCLTGVGMIAYLIIFMWEADTPRDRICRERQ